MRYKMYHMEVQNVPHGGTKCTTWRYKMYYRNLLMCADWNGPSVEEMTLASRKSDWNCKTRRKISSIFSVNLCKHHIVTTNIWTKIFDFYIRTSVHCDVIVDDRFLPSFRYFVQASNYGRRIFERKISMSGFGEFCSSWRHRIRRGKKRLVDYYTLHWFHSILRT